MFLILGLLFSMRQILSFPMPMTLVSSTAGTSVAYVLDESGVRSVWFARAPEYAPRRLWSSGSDDGQEITNLSISRDGKYVVYVRGGDHDANWTQHPWPDPDSSSKEQEMNVVALPTDAGAAPKALGAGDAPAISPDGTRVAFVHDPDDAVWSAPLDGSKAASRLFFDRGKDSELQWSPDGKALAFTSDRDDHSFIGVYRDDATPLEYLAPSTSRDFSPQWSPDGARLAYVRIAGSGGPPQDPLTRHPTPWAIWVATADGRGRQAWDSGNSLRDSLPEINGPQLHWVAGDRLMFISEATNWPHVYVVAANGGAAQLLTPGNFMVEDAALSPDLRTLYYTANTGNTAGDDDRRHIFHVSVDGGAPLDVTSGRNSEWSPAATSDGVAYMQAGAKAPMTIAENGRTLDADQVPADFPTSQLVVPREVSFRASDGTLVHGQIFDAPGGAAKKPAVIFVHGGPPRQMLLTWHYFDYYSYAYGTNQYLASRGFIVLSVNYRLGIGYGHDFHHPPHAGPAGAAEYKDVLAAAHDLLANQRVDRTRIGIWGGSYGGYLTALALAKNSDIFKAGVDFHGVHDWTMFPQWFDPPVQRYQTYDRKKFLRTAWLSSPDAYIATWHSPVLLIQGDDDRNVPFHQMVDLVQRLSLAHVPFEQLVIPNDIHGFLRWQSWLDADQATADYLQNHLMR
ncbi:MAG: LpqB family beta-propeller domain-containing protein [Candidatus Eremiobacteraeota bacterium]|nr:LpqB family beta-propeller domain-containing protein [Candidatus Eremiobacteraeota bacterium]